MTPGDDDVGGELLNSNIGAPFVMIASKLQSSSSIEEPSFDL